MSLDIEFSEEKKELQLLVVAHKADRKMEYSSSNVENEAKNQPYNLIGRECR